MTREQAEEMVDDLMQAHHDYETYGKKSYRQDYLDQKERVIAALKSTAAMPLPVVKWGHLFSWDQVERLANQLASEASSNRPSAMIPNETRVVVALLRNEVERLKPTPDATPDLAKDALRRDETE